jgi:hypothetical protein
VGLLEPWNFHKQAGIDTIAKAHQETRLQGLDDAVSSELPAMSEDDEEEPEPQQAPFIKQGLEDFPPTPLPLPGEFVCRLVRTTHLAKHHPFAPVLDQWHKEGLPVDCGPPWSKEAARVAAKRGNHVSAITLEAITTIKDDVDYQIKAGFMKLLP